MRGGPLAKDPRLRSIDSSVAFVRDPYLFISTEAQRLGSDLFETRILAQPTVCVTGPDAARFVDDPASFIRKGAMPRVVATPLLGQGGVQGLDGEDHSHRKAMIMSLMAPKRLDDLTARSVAGWHKRADLWSARDRVTLYDEAKLVFTEAVCGWAGVPLAPSEVARRAGQLSARYEGAGAVGPGHIRARVMRRRTEQWIADLIERVRDGRLTVPEDRALHVFATYRGRDGQLLDAQVAATDLLSVLRPTVAVSVFIMFAAHALHHHLKARDIVRSGDDADVTRFVQEVRRVHPFFPLTAARAQRDLEWRGYRIPAGRRVLLDLYGTNHDARTWQDPDAFQPERFRTWDGDPATFIPQGDGDAWPGHRCAGEWITINLMSAATSFLSRDVTYDVPAQDLSVDRKRLPAMVRSRFIMANGRRSG